MGKSDTWQMLEFDPLFSLDAVMAPFPSEGGGSHSAPKIRMLHRVLLGASCLGTLLQARLVILR